jgi:hypothetical protein
LRAAATVRVPAGTTIKAIGSGHSWSGVAAGADIVLDMSALDRVEPMTLDGRDIVRVGAGVTSWGLSYGDRGRMGLDWNAHFVPTTNYHVFYAIRSTTDGGDSPPAAT